MLQDLNKESLLMLYLADELSVRDRAEVDRMLSADAGLRIQFNSLSGASEAFESQMASLDAADPLNEPAALRNIGRALRQRMTEQLVQTAPIVPAKQSKLRYPWWAYPAAGAAVVLIAFISWWGNRPDPMLKIQPETPGRIAHLPGVSPQVATNEEDSQIVEGIKNNFESSNLTQPEKSVASLNAAEDQIAELSRSQSDFRYSAGNE